VHSYRWATTDNLVRALARNELTLMPLLFQAPRWAWDPVAKDVCKGWGGEVDAGHVDDFAGFAAAFAARYGRGGSFWSQNPDLPYRPVERYEIWNEPNHRWAWCPTPNPNRFARLYSASRDALHRVDPEAMAVMGGLGASGRSILQGGQLTAMGLDLYLPRMIAHVPSLVGGVDAVAIHTYKSDPSDMLADLGWFRALLRQLVLGEVPIMLTEFGWHTQGEPGAVPEEERTMHYTGLVNRLARTDCNLVGIAPHAWAKAEEDPADPEDWFGLADPLTGGLRPSGVAYADQVALFEGRGPTPAPSENVHACGSPPRPDEGAPPPEDEAPPPEDEGPPPPGGGVVPPLVDGVVRPIVEGIVGRPPGDPAPPPKGSDRGPSADTTAPLVGIEGGPRGRTRSRSAVFRIRAQDDGTIRRIRCRLVGRRWRPCAGRVRVRHLSPGRRRFLAQAVDVAGNSGLAARAFRVVKRSR
jgi:hypothetical protein